MGAIGAIDGSRPAIDDGSFNMSYAQLQSAVSQGREWLRSFGVRRCGLLAENGVPWIVSDLALLAEELVNVPLPGYFSESQLAHVLDDAAIDSILTDDPQRFRAGHPMFEHIATSEETGLALLQRARVDSAAQAAGISKITYTSGSTGTPKGVCLSTQAMETVAQSLVAATHRLGVERHICLLPLPTLLENIAGVYVPLMIGAQVLVQPARATGMSYGGLNVPLLLRAIEVAAPQSMVLVPELLRVLQHAVASGWRAPLSLKFIAVGGGAVSKELLQRAHAMNLPVYQGYGLSECSSVVCLNTPAENRPGSVGRPLNHAQVRVDSNGEICVRGATMSGYLGGESRSGEEIRTGDLGEIDEDGFVYVRGRLKNMFITSMGRNIMPEWVEGELTAEPAILQALVTGEAKPYPVALLTTRAGIEPSLIDRAIARSNSRLPDYARVRRWALFPKPPTFADGLLTANGRLRRPEIVTLNHQLIESLYEHAVRYDHELS